MSDAFLKTIRESPNDDAPRLVYADWLEEHGQADRAEFIRLQIDSAKLDRDNPARIALDERAVKRLEGNISHWVQQYLPIFGGSKAFTVRLRRWERENGLIVGCGSRSCIEFYRGFVHSVTVEPAVMFAHGDACFSPNGPAPVLQISSHNSQNPLDDYVQKLARSNFIDHVRGVSIDGGWCGTTDAGVDSLRTHPRLLSKIEGLHFHEVRRIHDSSILPLLQSPELVQLRKLSLDHTRCTFAVVRALFDIDRFNRVELLYLDTLIRTARNVARFAKSNNWKQLRILYLGSNGLRDGALLELCRPSDFPALEILPLHHNRLTVNGVRELVSSGFFPSLRIIGLGGNAVTINEVEALRSEFGPQIKFHFRTTDDHEGFGKRLLKPEQTKSTPDA